MPEEVHNFQDEEIQERVHKALRNFELNDIQLLQPMGSERNIAQRFARWLEEEFPDWNVDCEYNRIRDGTSKKARAKVAALLMQRVENGFIRLDEPKEIKVIPDIIIHRRGPGNNLLAIEIKTSNNRAEIEFDYEKLHAYREFEPLRYRFALFIRFQEPKEDDRIVAELQFLMG